MTLTEWRDHLEILGPDLTVWPPRLAEAGIALLSVSREAQDMFAVASGEGGACAPAPASSRGDGTAIR